MKNHCMKFFENFMYGIQINMRYVIKSIRLYIVVFDHLFAILAKKKAPSKTPSIQSVITSLYLTSKF